MQQASFKKRRLEDRTVEENSVVAKNSRFKGTLSGKEGVRVFGHLEGNVKSEHMVWIKKGGKIVGDVHCLYIIIEGELKGNIKSAEHVELRSEARVNGNIQTQKIAMAEGSFFRGEIHMPSEEDKPMSFVEKRQTIKSNENSGKLE
jgi:cytoskeletal protein CcmA (bactofilin family)